MTGDLSEFHDDLRAVASGLLAKQPGWGRVAESGWPGLEVPDAFGGADGTFAEVAVVLRETGRAAAPGPYPSVALAVGALNMLHPVPARDRLLRDTVSGSALPVVALDAERMEPSSPFRVVRTPGGPRLHGSAEFVLDAPAAGRLLVPALEPDGSAVIVDADPASLHIADVPVVDSTRCFGHVAADGVAVRPESLHRFWPRDPLRRLRDRAAVATACDSLGLSEAMLDATVAYAGVREQFGRPIGSFQAVKHACADMLVRVAVARELVAAAVRSQADDDPDASTAASMAKSYTCAAAVEVAGKAMQLHGGMGYTWESRVHVHLKRATLNRSLFGAPARHRARLAERYTI